MNISRLAIQRNVFTYLITIAFVVMGLVLFSGMSVSYWPDFSAPVLLVNTVYPGASATEVEDSVTQVLEKALTGVSNVDEVESTSFESNSFLMVRFVWGADIEKAASEVKEKIDMIAGDLPREALRSNILKVQNLLPPSYQFTLESSEMNNDELKKFFEEKLEFYFLKLGDVAAVELAGGRERFVSVEPDPEMTRRYDITVDTLSNAFRAEHLDLPAGIIRAGMHEFLLKTKGTFDNFSEIEELIVAYEGNTPVRLKDVAEVRFGYQRERSIFTLNGKRILGVSIRKKNDGNAVSLSDEVEYEIGRIKRLYPHLTFNKIKDEADFIRKSIRNVLNNALLGGLLAAFVIFLFLGNIKNTFIILISIPVSLISSFVFMRLFGLSINTISLGGLAMAVGMIVDASIVMLENIDRNLTLNPVGDRLEVFRIASAEVVSPITASIATSLVVFLPLAFLKGLAAVLLGELALTIVFALTISLVVSLGLVPLLSFKLIETEKRNRLSQVWQRFIAWLEESYRQSLIYLTAKKQRSVVLLAVMFVIFVAAMGMVRFLETEMLPVPDEGEFRIEIRFEPSTSLETNRQFSDILRMNLMSIAGVQDVYQVIGQNMTYSNEEANVTTTFVLLEKERRDIKTIMVEAEVMLRESRFPGMEFRLLQSSATEGMTKPALDVLIYDDDLDRLRTEAEKLKKHLAGIAGLSNLDLSLKPGKTELQLLPDRRLTSYYGLPTIVLAAALRAHYSGIKVGTLTLGDSDDDIKIIYPDQDRSPYGIEITAFNGMTFKLSELGSFRLSPSPAYIKRFNQQRFAEIKGDLLAGSKRELDRQVDRALEEYHKASDLRVEKRGASRGIVESFQTLGIALMVSIFLVYVVMGSQFNSFVQPFIISFTIPLAVVGVILILFLTGTPLNLNSFLGGVVLAGIVVNNGILLVDFINQKFKSGGMAFREAVVEGSALRLRPILMTALTTILGMLPLALGLGEGSESLAPLARSVVGGLTVSTFTTLLVIPALYFLMARKKI